MRNDWCAMTSSNDEFWDKAAASYDKFLFGSNALREAYRAIESFLKSHLNPQMEVLELAAGPGTLSCTIASCCKKLLATDNSQHMVAETKKRDLPSNVSVTMADACNLALPNNSFDAVVIANALHVIPDPQQAAAEILRVLRPGGLLLAPTFTWGNEPAPGPAKSMRLLGYQTYSNWNQAEYVGFFEQHGFEVVSTSTVETPLLPLCFAQCKKPANARCN